MKILQKFDRKSFLKEVKSQIYSLELKPRIKVFADAKYKISLEIIDQKLQSYCRY